MAVGVVICAPLSLLFGQNRVIFVKTGYVLTAIASNCCVAVLSVILLEFDNRE